MSTKYKHIFPSALTLFMWVATVLLITWVVYETEEQEISHKHYDRIERISTLPTCEHILFDIKDALTDHKITQLEYDMIMSKCLRAIDGEHIVAKENLITRFGGKNE